jgi:flagellar M-ring protein FliF
MLAGTLGAGKAQVRVKSSLNVDQTKVDEVTYAKKGTALTTEVEEEGLRARGAGATTPPAGVSSNVVPSYAQGAAGGNSNSNYDRRKERTEYGVNKKVTSTLVAPGSVDRLDVALMVDNDVPQAQVAALQRSVAALAGIAPARGDTLAVSRLDFAPAPEPEAPAASPLPIPAAFAGALKWVGLVLGVGIFLLLVRRNLRRREREGVAVEPTWLREIEQSVPVAALETTMAAHRLPDPESQKREALRSEFEELVKAQPDQVAMQVGAWIKEG